MSTPPPDLGVLRGDGFALNLDTHTLGGDGTTGTILLPPLPFRLLRALAQKPRRTWPRAELIELLWPGQPGIDLDERLDFHIGRLRHLLRDSARAPRFIQTVRGVGFRFLPELVLTPAAAAAPPPPPLAPTPDALPSGASARARYLWPGIAAAVSLLLLGLGAAMRAPNRAAAPRPTPHAADAYATVLVQGHYRIARMLPAGGTWNLLPMPWSDALLLGAAPDAASLLVESPVPPDPALTDAPLWLLHNGSAQRLGQMMGHAAAWYPDGGGILIARGHGLWYVDADGGEGRLLASLPGPASGLAWSTDGLHLHFSVSPRDGAPTAAWEMETDGGQVQALSDDLVRE